MASLADVRAQFPEFNGVTDALILRMLAASLLELSTVIWGAFGPDANGLGTKADQGQLYLTAHKLARSPFGQNAKMVMARGEGYQQTTYGREFELLMRGVTSGYRVA